MSESVPRQVLAIAVDTPQHAGLASTLDYTCEESLSPGTMVRVPLGKRQVAGIVWDRTDGNMTAGVELRPVSQAMHALPPLSAAWRRLIVFAAAYYQRGLGELALSVLPP
jgi:primosomal protein N' (replication factor Y)